MTATTTTTSTLLAHQVIDSPIGSLLLVASRVGIVRVAFEREGHADVIDELGITDGASDHTSAAAHQLDEYFAGRRRRFDVAVDLRLARGFRRQVVEALPHIAYGTTASYTEVARLVGRPNAVRAVGSACSHNPLSIVLPCHRVVRTDGSFGDYLGGTEAKATLLALEARVAA